MDNAIVTLRNVSMSYHTLREETLAIDNISFDVYDKEFLTILGPSGCGKSTILSLIYGLISPSKGEIRISSKIENPKDQLVAYMLQHDHLFNWRTIEQNVLLGLEIKKNVTNEAREYVTNLLNTYGLGKFLNHYPHQLSGGMKQKAALIRTLAVNPKILLLDEPFSALDYQTRIILSEEIKEIIHNEKKVAILVTHDISEAISLSDRIIILSNRPSKIKKIININFKDTDITNRRSHPKFQEYFEIIWQELQ